MTLVNVSKRSATLLQRYIAFQFFHILLKKTSLLLVVVLPNYFRWMGVRSNFTETEQWGHTQCLDQRSKMEVVPKMARQTGSDAEQSRR